jgi:pseudouridine-5'-phosphate glycosidase
MYPDLDIAPEIAAALADRRPIVALESTIIAHGMPYPDNLDVAREIERIIRQAGAVPATIAILRGRLKVGLSEGELQHLAQSREIAKASGGIGGVHRGAETTGDISADLTEFTRSPVAVVSAGAKAILDLPRTLEMLETLSVPVIGYGCDEFPSFYSRSSGLRLQARADTAAELANILAARWRLDAQGGILVANPIPAVDEMSAAVIEEKIRDALSHAQIGGVTGKEVTPYLLSRIRILTEGASQRANVALVLNNARLAAEIAVALTTIKEG